MSRKSIENLGKGGGGEEGEKCVENALIAEVEREKKYVSRSFGEGRRFLKPFLGCGPVGRSPYRTTTTISVFILLHLDPPSYL